MAHWPWKPERIVVSLDNDYWDWENPDPTVRCAIIDLRDKRVELPEAELGFNEIYKLYGVIRNFEESGA